MTLKTQPNDDDVEAFIDGLDDPVKREDCRALVAMMTRATGEPPRMWGKNIVGFDRYEYRYASGREGAWFITGFSPRKREFSIYIMAGFESFASLMARLGKHKAAKSCLYVKRLADLDEAVLERMVTESVAIIRERYP